MAFELNDDEDNDEMKGLPPSGPDYLTDVSLFDDPKELRAELVLALINSKPWSSVKVLMNWVCELEDFIYAAEDDILEFDSE